ncbi:hypothetical protein H0H92_009792 [Tricholoma furcatifolium]|nr:hypothetical protein H0H92_009792 [Tricholoma furcatifolium]
MYSHKRSASSCDFDSPPNSPVSCFPSSPSASPSLPTSSTSLFTPPASSTSLFTPPASSTSLFTPPASSTSLFTPSSSPKAPRPNNETFSLASEFEDFVQGGCRNPSEPDLKRQDTVMFDRVEDGGGAREARRKRLRVLDTDEPNPLGARQNRPTLRSGKGKENALSYRSSARKTKRILRKTDLSHPAFSSLRDEDSVPAFVESSLGLNTAIHPAPAPSPSPLSLAMELFEQPIVPMEQFTAPHDLRPSWIASLVDQSVDADEKALNGVKELNDEDFWNDSEYTAPIPMFIENELVALFENLQLSLPEDVIMDSSPAILYPADTEMEEALPLLIPLYDVSVAGLFTERWYALEQGVYCGKAPGARYAECISPSWRIRAPDKSITIGCVRAREDDDQPSPHDKRRRLIIAPSPPHTRRKRKKC